MSQTQRCRYFAGVQQILKLNLHTLGILVDDLDTGRVVFRS
jgi:hypothetical protein